MYYMYWQEYKVTLLVTTGVFSTSTIMSLTNFVDDAGENGFADNIPRAGSETDHEAESEDEPLVFPIELLQSPVEGKFCHDGEARHRPLSGIQRHFLGLD